MPDWQSWTGKIPYEKWIGNAPHVDHFREFGCQVYPLKREPNKKKFQSRSKKRIFVGYAENFKTYKVCLPEERRTDISRDVKFIAMPEMSVQTRGDTANQTYRKFPKYWGSSNSVYSTKTMMRTKKLTFKPMIRKSDRYSTDRSKKRSRKTS